MRVWVRNRFRFILHGNDSEVKGRVLGMRFGRMLGLWVGVE